MEWTVIEALIVPELAGVLALCWVVGYGAKLTPRIPDWLIIYIVTAVGVVMSGLLMGWGVDSVIQGVLVAAVAVYGNQVVKQATKGANNDADA
ncbi:hypothetical protein PA598K_01323 [Paenibacillus sp. 598K]|uniref:phage holin family protein n=1 Tax=Paenibacillus sp. 598K TaxID=1117987 RepID=UPI000FF911E1|nr:phage holin family protein [Paenibacillus sp. 598K]GBF73038.1 hypothetical protein PA598K_01323 [Paenibacillus sp. 598K]